MATEMGGLPLTTPGKLFLGGISWETSEDGLRQHFSQFGTIVDCVLMSDPQTNRPRGFGFVTFENPADAARAAQDQFQMIDGRRVEVKSAVPKEAMTNQLRTKKVFVGGIPWTVTDDMMLKYFSQFGHVLEAQIIRDHTSGKSRGFGYVSFEDEKTVDKIIEMPHVLADKSVDVKKAVPKGTAQAKARRAASSPLDPVAMAREQSYHAIFGSGHAPTYAHPPPPMHHAPSPHPHSLGMLAAEYGVPPPSYPAPPKYGHYAPPPAFKGADYYDYSSMFGHTYLHPQLMPHFSPSGSPNASPHASPHASPYASPARSPVQHMDNPFDLYHHHYPPPSHHYDPFDAGYPPHYLPPRHGHGHEYQYPAPRQMHHYPSSKHSQSQPAREESKEASGVTSQMASLSVDEQALHPPPVLTNEILPTKPVLPGSAEAVVGSPHGIRRKPHASSPMGTSPLLRERGSLASPVIGDRRHGSMTDTVSPLLATRRGSLSTRHESLGAISPLLSSLRRDGSGDGSTTASLLTPRHSSFTEIHPRSHSHSPSISRVAASNPGPDPFEMESSPIPSLTATGSLLSRHVTRARKADVGALSPLARERGRSSYRSPILSRIHASGFDSSDEEA